MGFVYNLYFFKGMLIVLDMGVLVFLVCIAKYRTIPLYFLLIHAWHPLGIIEIAGSGHQDIVGIFFLTGCLYFWQKQNIWGSASMLAASFLSKLFPLLLFPLLIRNRGKSPYLMLFALTILLYSPFYSSDYLLFRGLTVYSKTWQANGSVFYVTNLLINSVFIAKVAVGLLFLAIYLFTYFRLHEFDIACFVVLGSFLILSPTLHPWYLLWVIPLSVIIPNKAWLWLTLSVAVYYHVLIDYYEKGVWQEQIWIKMLIFIPFFVLLTLSFLNKKRPSHA
jgi:hypothetical protein